MATLRFYFPFEVTEGQIKKIAPFVTDICKAEETAIYKENGGWRIDVSHPSFVEKSLTETRLSATIYKFLEGVGVGLNIGGGK